MKIETDLQGAKQLKKFWAKVPYSARDRLERKILRDSANVIAREAKKNVEPYVPSLAKGLKVTVLRSTIESSTAKVSVKGKANPLQHLWELGTKEHKPKSKKLMAFTWDLEKVFARKVKGIKGIQFLGRAFQTKGGQAVDKMITQLKKYIDGEFKSL
ncbi:hypothetical protein [Flammeovirga sp. OC4]|uniref:hypothetical protein n=1 Tax=Flammeovirga sp. OC4 TaxID=1382345 RepID=UPI0005C57E8B|nr:hypothetical protein [Flammeovirga sp. OC4]